MLPPQTSLWAIQPDYFESIRAALPGMLRMWPSQEKILEAREAAAKQLRRVSGNVAVLPLYGIVEQRISGYGFMFGGVGTEQVGQAIDALVAAKDVAAIVLDIDSPGGTVPGVEELSDKIYGARGSKPIVAVANSMAASAAYWIATAADQLAVTTGGDVGSVGVFAGHIDYSKMLDENGIKVTLVRAGKYKAEMNPYEPLSAEARDNLQMSVDETYGKFTKALARNRGVSVKDVRDNFGQGRVVSADAAVAAGMADRVATLEDVLGRLMGGGSSGAARAASVEILRLRHEHAKAMETRSKSA